MILSASSDPLVLVVDGELVGHTGARLHEFDLIHANKLADVAELGRLPSQPARRSNK